MEFAEAATWFAIDILASEEGVSAIQNGQIGVVAKVFAIDAVVGKAFKLVKYVKKAGDFVRCCDTYAVRFKKIPEEKIDISGSTSLCSNAPGRLPQDVAVNPTAPDALPLNRPIGRSSTQNARAQRHAQKLQDAGAQDVRINQQQINSAGDRVGINRPDLSYTNPKTDQRVNVEYERSGSTRGEGHRQRILANDPDTIILTNLIVMLSDGEYSPITGTIGFIEGMPAEVSKEFYNWQAPLFSKTTAPLQITELNSMSFSNAMMRFSTLTTRASRWIFLAAGDHHTAMFSNCTRGLDPSPIAPLSVKKCKKKGFRVTAVSNNHRGKKYSSRIIEVFSPECSNPFSIERSLYCANDGGKWKFGSSGTPYSFEDESRYSAPLIRDRFTIEDLWRFMSHFEIEGDCESFYGGERTKSFEVSMKGELLPNMKEVSLGEIN